VVIDLAAIRNAAGVTQAQLAERLGVGQGQISRTEHQSDLLVSTLIDYLQALGVEAELTIKVKRRRITQTVTDTGEGS
jgi:transcriptional regulator with XRE-family HTH domain